EGISHLLHARDGAGSESRGPARKLVRASAEAVLQSQARDRDRKPRRLGGHPEEQAALEKRGPSARQARHHPDPRRMEWLVGSVSARGCQDIQHLESPSGSLGAATAVARAHSAFPSPPFCGASYHRPTVCFESLQTHPNDPTWTRFRLRNV